MSGLLLSDSLLKQSSKENQNTLRDSFHLKSVQLSSHPGFTTEKLIGPDGVVHNLLRTGKFTHLFLCSGANDFNKCPGQTWARKARWVMNEIQTHLCSFSKMYPDIPVFLFPIPFRKVCKMSHRNEKYPNNYDPEWIKVTNIAMQFFQDNFQVCKCHESQIKWVRSPDLKSWDDKLAEDGLHLTPKGGSTS